MLQRQVLLFTLWLVACQAPVETVSEDIDIHGAADVYGTDDRQEPANAAELFQRIAESTAVVTTLGALRIGANDDLFFTTETLTEKIQRTYGAPLCETERFRDQPAPGFCSAFLIAPDMVATAGHCINIRQNCGEIRFVFGFANGDGDVLHIEDDDFYQCASVLGHLWDQDALSEADLESRRLWSDWAVVLLDRPVVGRPPIPLRRSPGPDLGDAVAALGYPSGVPLKITSGTVVDDAPELYFNTDLDIYQGNSGSVVVGEEGLGEGIVIRGSGGNSWVSDGGCIASRLCEDWDPQSRRCLGNHVMRIEPVLQFVDADRIVRLGTTPDDNDIPDGTGAFQGELTVDDEGTISFVTLNVGVFHARPADLRISLERVETGRRVVLFERPTLRPAGTPIFSQTTDEFDGELAAGRWRVIVEDLEAGGNGSGAEVSFFQIVVGIGDPGAPPRGATFIGSPCVSDADCAFDPLASCHDQSFCTIGCEGYCPDRGGFASTFCTSLDGGQTGSCVANAHALNEQCASIPGTTPQLAERFIGSSSAAERSSTVCIQ